MPPAVAVPVGLAALGMVSQNVQNKAALKNNENQQRAGMENAQKARDQFNQWTKANPSPLAGLGIAGPPTITNQGYQPGNVNASAILGGGTGVSGTNSGLPANGALGSDPNIAALIAQILGHNSPAGPANPASPAQNMTPPLATQKPRFQLPAGITNRPGYMRGML